MGAVIIGCVIAVFILLVIIGRHNEHSARKQMMQSFADSYGTAVAHSNRTPGKTATGHYQRHRGDDCVDDATWNDLGMDEVYASLDCSQSSAGEETLYTILRSPHRGEEELRFIDSLASELDSDEALRVKLQLTYSDLGKGRESLYEYLDRFGTLKEESPRGHIILDLLYLPAIASAFISPLVCVIAVVILIGTSIVTYFKHKARIEPYISCIAGALRLSECAVRVTSESLVSGHPVLSAACKQVAESNAGLSSLCHGPAAFWLLSSGRMRGSGSPLDIICDYLRMLFHFDLIAFASMQRRINEHADDTDRVFTGLGRIEAAISIGSYRRLHLDRWCKPDLTAKRGLVITNAYHPLLPEPVTNSIDTDSCVLLTGSNASGKSTFLRTVGLCALLAQTIYTVPASSYASRPRHILCAMSAADSLERGESLYVAEIMRLKEIMEYTKLHAGEVLCLADEILRGTNTVERIAGSCEILRSLSAGGITVAATHDRELTELLADLYVNMHFDETFRDGELSFNYKLLPGRSETCNAIKLLEVIGFDRELTMAASKRADTFTRTGVWTV